MSQVEAEYAVASEGPGANTLTTMQTANVALEQAIDQHDRALGMLIDRLHPVLSPHAMLESAGRDDGDRETRSPQVEFVIERTRLIRNLTTAVEQVTARLDI